MDTSAPVAGYGYDDPALPGSPVGPEEAWCKSVTLQIALWSRPYAEQVW